MWPNDMELFVVGGLIQMDHKEALGEEDGTFSYFELLGSAEGYSLNLSGLYYKNISSI